MTAHSKNTRFLISAAVALLVALTPGSAIAASKLQPGVHVDPGSPAGKQYAIPIPAARSETSGTKAPPGSPAAENPPPFGAGITPSGRGSASTGAGSGHGSGSAGRGTSTGTGHAGGAGASSAAAGLAHTTTTHAKRAIRSAVSSVLARSVVSSGAPGGHAWLALAGGGVLVLLLGGGCGLALRRRS